MVYKYVINKNAEKFSVMVLCDSVDYFAESFICKHEQNIMQILQKYLICIIKVLNQTMDIVRATSNTSPIWKLWVVGGRIVINRCKENRAIRLSCQVHTLILNTFVYRYTPDGVKLCYVHVLQTLWPKQTTPAYAVGLSV